MPIKNSPIFIVGSPRSGTSVLTWCLGQHTNILPLPETHWIARLAVNMRHLYKLGTAHGRFTHLGALGWDERDFFAAFGEAVDQFVVNTREPRLRFIRRLSAQKKGLSESQIEELERKGKLSPDPELVTGKNYQLVRSVSDTKLRWVDGTPENTYYMYALAMMFPSAKFIHILREPNDVATSLMKFSQAGSAGKDHAEADAYAAWHRYVEFAVKGERALGAGRVLRISYADLINNPETTLCECFRFLGEEFSRDALLPLNEKINSSKVDAEMSVKPTTREGNAANEFYRTILKTEPALPDVEINGELALHFRTYADEINKSPFH